MVSIPWRAHSTAGGGAGVFQPVNIRRIVRTLRTFVALSAILTGVAADKLHPLLDTYGTAQEYLTYATAKAGAQFAGLMKFYNANSTNPAPNAVGVDPPRATLPLTPPRASTDLKWAQQGSNL